MSNNQNDQVWQGADWQDTQNKLEVIDGMVHGMDAESERKLKAGQNLPGVVTDYM